MKTGTKEYYAEYYQKNKDKHRETMKHYRINNVEVVEKDNIYHKEKYTREIKGKVTEEIRQSWREQALKRTQDRRTFINEYKSKCSCKKCNESRSYVLDFHHIDPTQKDFDLGNGSKYGIEKLKEELEKCITLCRNCHAEFHYLEKEQNITIQQYLE